VRAVREDPGVGIAGSAATRWAGRLIEPMKIEAGLLAHSSMD
jgi:hypothetical protein